MQDYGGIAITASANKIFHGSPAEQDFMTLVLLEPYFQGIDIEERAIVVTLVASHIEEEILVIIRPFGWVALGEIDLIQAIFAYETVIS